MKVKFMPQNIELPIEPGESVLEVAHKNGIPIRSTCNGMPSCAECRVNVTDGEYNVLPPSKKELSLIGTGYYIDQRRLSCQMHCFGDVTVDTKDHIERANEGPITKKFLSRVQKSSAQESHSVGGVLIEQEESVLKEISSSVKEQGPENQQQADFLGRERNQQKQPNRQEQGGGGGNRNRHRGGRGRNNNRR
jgi:ferredoxin